MGRRRPKARKPEAIKLAPKKARIVLDEIRELEIELDIVGFRPDLEAVT
jgi:hypothetical protein